MLIFIISASFFSGLAIWMNQDKLLSWWNSPKSDYSEMPLITMPVYLFPNAWAARPDISSRATLLPDGVEALNNNKEVDVFFIHSSAYWGENWNASFDDEKSAKLIEGQMLAMDLTAFNECCRVFAPRYRQANGISLTHSTANGRQSLDMATNDIERAFRHYLREEQNGRPFIIVGHGQGAILAMRLLDRRIENEDQRFSRFVAAYLFGVGVPIERFATNWNKITVCETPEDTQCVVAWELYTETADPLKNPNTIEVWYDRHWTVLSEVETLCINPLTWKKDSIAATPSGNPISLIMDPGFNPQSISLGTPKVDPTRFDTLPKLESGLTQAQCRDGFLHVNLSENSTIKGMGADEGNLDQHSISLFWMSIRKNATLRTEEFINKRN